MDLQHLSESFLGTAFGAGVAWGVMKMELRFLKSAIAEIKAWMVAHQQTDDEHFTAMTTRIDNLFSNKRG